jgi:ribonuclease P protein component
MAAPSWHVAVPRAVNVSPLRERIASLPVIPKPDYRLPRSRVLRLRLDFQRIKVEGKRQAGTYLVCNYMIRPGEPRLAGFIVPKICGNAVARNRIKRRLRELYRHIQHGLPEHLQSVWIARKPSSEAAGEAFAKDFYKLLARTGLHQA